MRAALFVCVLLSLVGSILRLLAASAGGEAVAKCVSVLCGMLTVLVLAGVGGSDIELPAWQTPEDETTYFRSLSSETLDAVCKEAERQLSERLCLGMEEACGYAPTACSVTIDRENLQVAAVKVSFGADSLLVSGYEVKSYIRAQCGAAAVAEVIFE